MNNMFKIKGEVFFLEELHQRGIVSPHFTVVRHPDWNGGHYCRIYPYIFEDEDLQDYEYIEGDYTLQELLEGKPMLLSYYYDANYDHDIEEGEDIISLQEYIEDKIFHIGERLKEEDIKDTFERRCYNVFNK